MKIDAARSRRYDVGTAHRVFSAPCTGRTRSRHLRAWALAIALVLSVTAEPAFAKRLALVIGNNDYKNVEPLKNARQDAKAISETLSGLGFSVTLRQDLTLSAMKSTLREFKAQVAGGDEVVFYFSGHGVQFEGTNYLVPIDIVAESEAQVVDDAVPLQRVLDDLRDQKARFALAIVDACRDNPFKGQGRAIGGRGLAPVAAASGQMVMYSAGAGQEALDRLGPNDKDPNGVFTRVLIKHMNQPGVSADRMLKSVAYEVVDLARAAHHEQVPALYDQTIGEFYFKAAPANASSKSEADAVAATAAPAAAAHLPSPAELEESYWQRIKDSTDPEDFKEYGQQFPKGAHAAEAALMARKLTRQAAVATTPAAAPATQSASASSTAPVPAAATGATAAGAGVTIVGPHAGYLTTATAPGAQLYGTLTINADGSFRYDGTNGVVRGVLNTSNPDDVTGSGTSMLPKKLGVMPQRYPDGSITAVVVLKGKIVNGVLQGQYRNKFDTGLFVFNLAKTN